MDRRVTPPTWGPPFPCRQALKVLLSSVSISLCNPRTFHTRCEFRHNYNPSQGPCFARNKIKYRKARFRYCYLLGAKHPYSSNRRQGTKGKDESTKPTNGSFGYIRIDRVLITGLKQFFSKALLLRLPISICKHTIPNRRFSCETLYLLINAEIAQPAQQALGRNGCKKERGAQRRHARGEGAPALEAHENRFQLAAAA